MGAEARALHTPSTTVALPPDWAWRRLDSVCDGIFDCPHSTPILSDHGPYIARSQDVRSGVFRVDDAGRVSEATYKERIARAEPQHGDLLYSREGTYFGIAAEVPDGIRVCLGQRMVLIRANPSVVDFRFLRFWLNSPTMALHIHGHRDGSVAERLNLPTIRGLPVALPPLFQQRAIARILGTLDDRIELNRRMSETLEAMARSIFKSWFVDFDPVRAKAEGRDPNLPKVVADLFPDRLLDSDLGEIPAGWKVGTVDDEFNLTMGQSPPGETYNETGDGLPLYQGRTDFGFRFPTQRMFCTAPTRYADTGDTLISVRAPVGDINMAGERCCIGRGVAAARHKSGSRSYTYCFMHSIEEVFDRFEAEGTVFGSISKKDFHKIRRVMPPPRLVEAFERVAAPIDERISNNDGQSHTLAKLRDTLLPRLLSGDIRVPEATKAAATAI